MKAAIYVRISQDRTGEELGVDRQREQCRTLAKARGWQVVEEFVENDTSAAGKVERPQWERMMAAVEADMIDVVIGWTIDRTLRSGRDRLRMLESGKRHDLLITLVRGSDMDLGTPAGRLAADILGAVALNEIEQKSDRQKAAHLQAARKGRRIGGRRPFGYEQDGMTLRENEAKALKAAYEDYLGGTPLSEIARRWNKAKLLSGVKRKSDGAPTEWNHSGVRSVLLNARYAGFRVHNGEIVGPAAWPALVDEPLYRSVVALLGAKASETKPRGGRRLLTGIARCGVCGESIHVGGNKAGTPPVYRCPTGKHVTRRAEQIERQVEALVLRRLTQPDVAELLHQSLDVDTAELTSRATSIRDEMDAVALERAQGVITPRQFTIMNTELAARLGEAERAMEKVGRDSAVTELVSAENVAARWESMNIGQRRAVIASLLDIKIHSGGRGVRKPPPDTVEVAWRNAK